MAAPKLASLSKESWLLIIEEWAPCWNDPGSLRVEIHDVHNGALADPDFKS